MGRWSTGGVCTGITLAASAHVSVENQAWPCLLRASKRFHVIYPTNA